MIVGLQIGKETSTGRPGKNYMKLLGRQLNEYALLAAHHCKEIDKLFISTDSPAIKSSASRFNAKIIDRPPELATPESLTEDVLVHAFEHIVKEIGEIPEMVVLLFANTPTVDYHMLSKGIQILRDDTTLDSCFSVAKYNMFSPTRAKSMKNGILEPFSELDKFDEITSIRSSQGDVFFADLTIQILRPSCFNKIDDGTPPLKWMGQRTFGLEIEYGFDLDEAWQIPVLEHWLKSHGFSEEKTPYSNK
jgi:CMP-N-acetylneuraminic acid synthetase